MHFPWFGLKNLLDKGQIPVPGYIRGLELDRVSAGACRQLSLKSVGSRRKLPVPRAPINFKPCKRTVFPE